MKTTPAPTVIFYTLTLIYNNELYLPQNPTLNSFAHTPPELFPQRCPTNPPRPHPALNPNNSPHTTPLSLPIQTSNPLPKKKQRKPTSSRSLPKKQIHHPIPIPISIPVIPFSNNTRDIKSALARHARVDKGVASTGRSYQNDDFGVLCMTSQGKLSRRRRRREDPLFR
jgi:hypothetical protein